MVRSSTFLKIALLGVCVFPLFSGQSGAHYLDQNKFAPGAGQLCSLCHREVPQGVNNPWSESPMGHVGATCAIRRLEYFEIDLVRNLIKIGYPLSREDVIALDKTAMSFESKNRINVLEKILLDREFIHSRKNIDYFIKTEIVCDALRLLDQHDLPVANALIDELNKQTGWEKREQALLAYMAAKRDIRYQSNAGYLLGFLALYGSDQETVYNGENFQFTVDVMSGLSYFADLFVYKGDQNFLNLLIRYSSRFYGFPVEYLSHRFVDMFLLRPKVFLSALAVKDEQTINAVINSIVFGIRNSHERKMVKRVLKKDLWATDEHNKRRMSIFLIIDKLNTQLDLVVDETPPNAPDSRGD
jgi:hypothetical protein